jgi:PAS domain S-box-containing protein
MLRLPFWLAAAVTILGLLVIVGWLAHWTAIVQVLPHLAPMKFNTALCFIFCGTALMLLNTKFAKFVPWIGVFPGIVGLLTLLEYFTGQDFKVDQLFVRDYVLTATYFPGRMSPLASTCFLLLGVGFLLIAAGRKKNQALTATGLLACIVAVVAVVGLFGYLMGIQAAYGWGAYTRMAVHTATAFLALSIGLLLWTYQTTRAAGFNFLRWLPVTGSLTLMMMIAFVSTISFAQLESSSNWRKHTYDVLMKAQSFLGDLFETQRGMRNFVLTGQSAALDVYQTGVTNAPLHLAQLTSLTHDSPSQQARIKTLKADLNNSLAYSTELIRTRNTLGLPEAVQMEANGRGFALVNQTTYDLQAFSDEEQRLLNERSAATDADFHNTARLLVFGSMLAAGLLVLANWMINREMKRRRRAEQMQERLATEIKGLIESSGEGIYGIDLEGRCTFINGVGARTIGYDLYEVLGKDMHQLSHHSRHDGSTYPVEECPIVLSFKSDLSCRVDSEVFWRKDGSSFMVEYTSFPIVEASVIKGAVVTFRDISERRRYETEREKLITDLQHALVEVKTLSGMIPICGWCKNVRSDTGFWQNVEQYIRSRTDVKFSHGICPTCAEKFKGDVARANPPGIDPASGNFFK